MIKGLEKYYCKEDGCYKYRDKEVLCGNTGLISTISLYHEPPQEEKGIQTYDGEASVRFQIANQGSLVMFDFETFEEAVYSITKIQSTLKLIEQGTLDLMGDLNFLESRTANCSYIGFGTILGLDPELFKQTITIMSNAYSTTSITIECDSYNKRHIFRLTEKLNSYLGMINMFTELIENQ